MCDAVVVVPTVAMLSRELPLVFLPPSQRQSQTNHALITPPPTHSPTRPSHSCPRAVAVNLPAAFVLPPGLDKHDESVVVTAIQPAGSACGQKFYFEDTIVSVAQFSRYRRENRGVSTGN